VTNQDITIPARKATTVKITTTLVFIKNHLTQKDKFSKVQ